MYQTVHTFARLLRPVLTLEDLWSQSSFCLCGFKIIGTPLFYNAEIEESGIYRARWVT